MIYLSHKLASDVRVYAEWALPGDSLLTVKQRPIWSIGHTVPVTYETYAEVTGVAHRAFWSGRRVNHRRSSLVWAP